MTNVMPKKLSRQKILAYLRAHSGSTAAELSRALGVTPANMRHHLSILAGDGRVQVLGVRGQGERGRPVRVFGLGDALAGNNLAGLADAALTLWLEQILPEGREAAMRQAADRLSDGLGAVQAGALSRRLAQLTEVLNRAGYQARWEAHAHGPHLIFEHCPYAAVLAHHPELCRMDVLLLQARLEVSVEQLAKLERNERGVPVCVFWAQV